MKAEKFFLWWLERDTGKRHPAGVAFYRDIEGEYLLKIDFLKVLQEKEGTSLRLRPIGNVDDRLLFRAESVIRNGSKPERFVVGEGYTDQSTEGDIHIELGPFDRKLVLSSH